MADVGEMTSAGATRTKRPCLRPCGSSRTPGSGRTNRELRATSISFHDFRPDAELFKLVEEGWKLSKPTPGDKVAALHQLFLAFGP